MTTNNIKIIGFMGPKKSGKSLAASYLETKYGFERMSLATPIKQACQAIFSFTGPQVYGELKDDVDPHWGMKPRSALQDLGMHFREDYGEDFWCEVLISRARTERAGYVVVDDVRFANEIRFIQARGGAVVGIDRPVAKMLAEMDDHPSEDQDDLWDLCNAIVENPARLDPPQSAYQTFMERVLEAVEDNFPDLLPGHQLEKATPGEIEKFAKNFGG